MATDYSEILTSTPGHRLRFLFRDSAVYGFANALVKLSGLVTIPILTRCLAREEFGASEVIAVAIAMSVAVSTMGQDSAVARLYYEVVDEAERRQVVSQGLLTQVVLCVLSVCVLLLGAPWLVANVLHLTPYSGVFRIAAIGVPFVLLFQFWRGLLKWTFARRGFIALTLGSSITNLLFVVLLVLHYRKGVAGYFVGQLLCNLAFAGLGLFLCRRHLTWPRDFAYGRQLIRFGWPYMCVMMAGTAFPAIDRLCVSHALGLAPLATYAVGFKVASLLLFPILAFQTAWGPFCFAIYKEPDAALTYDKVLLFFSASLSVACLVLVCVAPPVIIGLASQRYLAGSVVVLPLVFGFAAEGISWIAGIGIDLSKRTGFSLMSYAIGVGTSILAVWSLVGPFGIVGVAAGIAVGKFVQSMSYAVSGHRVYPLRLKWAPAAAVMLVSLALSIMVVIVRLQSLMWQVAFRSGAVLVLIVIIYSWIIPASDRRNVATLIRLRLGFSA